MCAVGVRRVVIVRRQASRDPRSRRVALTPDKRGQITASTCAKNVIVSSEEKKAWLVAKLNDLTSVLVIAV